MCQRRSSSKEEVYYDITDLSSMIGTCKLPSRLRAQAWAWKRITAVGGIRDPALVRSNVVSYLPPRYPTAYTLLKTPLKVLLFDNVLVGKISGWWENANVVSIVPGPRLYEGLVEMVQQQR